MAGGVFSGWQAGFRIREDTVAESTDTWAAGLNKRWVPELDTNFRIRFLVLRPPEAASRTEYWDVYYSVNGGTLTYCDNAAGAFTPNSVVRAVDSGHAGFVEGADTTQLLQFGTTFQSNNNGVVESNGFSTPDMTWTGDSARWTSCEFEFCFQIRSEYVQPGDQIELFLFISDIALVGSTIDYGYGEDVGYPDQFVPVFVINKDSSISVYGGGNLIIGGGGTLAVYP